MEKKRNSAEGSPPALGRLVVAWTIMAGDVRAKAAKPNPNATISARASAANMPTIDATRLATALDDLSEFRNNFHLSQSNVDN